MTSSKRVLTVPELLEIILECADVKDIFVWQRVDRGWQTVIQNSHRIQDKILFRSPDYETKPSTESDYKKTVTHKKWNPIICQLGRHPFQDFFALIALCPIDQGCDWVTWRIYELDASAVHDLPLGFAEASWKEIFAIKPRLHKAMIARLDSDFQCVVNNTIWREGGITLGDFSQAYQELVLRASTETPAVDRDHDGYFRIAFRVE